MSVESRPWVTIVSGLPRSGTSLAMQMLQAGGLPLWTDAARPPDASNPRGYFEHSGVLALLEDADAMRRALGHAVKVVYPLLLRLPAGVPYRVLFLRRDLSEVLVSQRAMALALGAKPPAVADASLARYWADHLADGLATFRRRHACDFLEISYETAIAHPDEDARRIVEFLRLSCPPEQLAAPVDPALRRSRRPEA